VGQGINLLLFLALLSWAGAASAAPQPVAGPAVITVGIEAGAAEIMQLDDCIAAAMQGNDLLRAERWRRRSLDGKMKQALSTGLPTLDASGSWVRSRDPSFALDETFGGGGSDSGDSGGTGSPLDSLFAGFDFLPSPEDMPAQTFWRASLDLNWMINPALIMGAVGAAGSGIRHQEAVLAEVENAAIEGVVRAYHGMILAQERLEAVRADRANQEELLEILRLRFESGMATELDTLQAAVAVANIEPQLRGAERGLRTAAAQLNAAMGREPSAALAIRARQEVELDSIDRDDLLLLLEGRPDLRQMRIMDNLLRQNRRAQKAKMRPYLNLHGSYGLVGKTLEGLNDTGHDFWSASVALTVPLFDGFLTGGEVQESDASIARNQAELDGKRRQARVEVLDLLAAVEAARGTLHASQLNMTRAEELVATSKMMLRLGKQDYLSMLQAESNWARARANLIQARFDLLTQTAALKRAVGVAPTVPLADLSRLAATRGSRREG
jgi:outer membrane protein TolC